MVKYCENCGSALEEILLPTEDRPRLVCVQCGHVAYVNPKIVSGTLPVANGRVWLLRRGIEPRLGYWTYPAGYQEIDETTVDAAARETLEETGLRVEISGLFGLYSRAGSHVVNVVYLARQVDENAAPVLTREALEIVSFAPEDVPWADLAFPSTELVLQDWISLVQGTRSRS
ncbi:MAG: NUDIX hydrolase [Chloroflexota bacterium]